MEINPVYHREDACTGCMGRVVMGSDCYLLWTLDMQRYRAISRFTRPVRN